MNKYLLKNAKYFFIDNSLSPDDRFCVKQIVEKRFVFISGLIKSSGCGLHIGE